MACQAGGSGGAVAVGSATLVTFENAVNFTQNSGGSGGALSATSSSLVRFNGVASFVSNPASSQGTAVFKKPWNASQFV